MRKWSDDYADKADHVPENSRRDPSAGGRQRRLSADPASGWGAGAKTLADKLRPDAEYGVSFDYQVQDNYQAPAEGIR